jgi:hypothetical protein
MVARHYPVSFSTHVHYTAYQWLADLPYSMASATPARLTFPMVCATLLYMLAAGCEPGVEATSSLFKAAPKI